jgi:hypothetical protein
MGRNKRCPEGFLHQKGTLNARLLYGVTNTAYLRNEGKLRKEHFMAKYNGKEYFGETSWVEGIGNMLHQSGVSDERIHGILQRDTGACDATDEQLKPENFDRLRQSYLKKEFVKYLPHHIIEIGVYDERRAVHGAALRGRFLLRLTHGLRFAASRRLGLRFA